MIRLVWSQLGIAFSALLPLVNPLGSALVFYGVVGAAPPEVYRRLARRIAIYTVIFLLIIELIGAAILSFFGVSVGIVEVAGGLVLASMGWSLLNQQGAEEHQQEKQDQAAPCGIEGLYQQTFYPDLLSAYLPCYSRPGMHRDHAYADGPCFKSQARP
jgi:multiple antibiotic resistance protein